MQTFLKNLMDYPVASCEVSNPSFWLVQNLSEGFSPRRVAEDDPTSGNDRKKDL